MIYHIVAVAKNRVIGKDNKLPWHFPEDLKFFKKITTGCTVIMGRKTFESIGKPLPLRENFVLSRSKRSSGDNIKFFDSFETANRSVKTKDAFVIGGANVYRDTINRVDGIYLTEIPGEYDGDAHYPEIPDNFVEQSRTIIKKDPKIEVVYYEKKQ